MALRHERARCAPRLTRARGAQVMYGEHTPSVPALGAARFDGLALLQNAAVCYAVRDCKDVQCRKAVNGAIALSQVRAAGRAVRLARRCVAAAMRIAAR